MSDIPQVGTEQQAREVCKELNCRIRYGVTNEELGIEDGVEVCSKGRPVWTRWTRYYALTPSFITSVNQVLNFYWEANFTDVIIPWQTKFTLRDICKPSEHVKTKEAQHE